MTAKLGRDLNKCKYFTYDLSNSKHVLKVCIRNIVEQRNNIDNLFTARSTQTRLATKVFYRIKFKHTICTASDIE